MRAFTTKCFKNFENLWKHPVLDHWLDIKPNYNKKWQKKSQCRNFRIFLSLRFYVKSIWKNLEFSTLEISTLRLDVEPTYSKKDQKLVQKREIYAKLSF